MRGRAALTVPEPDTPVIRAVSLALVAEVALRQDLEQRHRLEDRAEPQDLIRAQRCHRGHDAREGLAPGAHVLAHIQLDLAQRGGATVLSPAGPKSSSCDLPRRCVARCNVQYVIELPNERFDRHVGDPRGLPYSDEPRHDTPHRRIAQLLEVRGMADENLHEPLIAREHIAHAVCGRNRSRSAHVPHDDLPTATRTICDTKRSTPPRKSTAPPRTTYVNPAPVPAASEVTPSAMSAS